MTLPPGDRTPQLQALMQQAGLSTFKELSVAAQVSEKQIRKLRRGDMATLRVQTFMQLSQALKISLTELLAVFATPSVQTSTEISEPLTSSPTAPTSHRPSTPDADLSALRQEYERLQLRLDQQKQELWQDFQQSSLQVLESLLLQLPTAAYAAQQNPQAPAVKLLPLLRPIDTLLNHWGIEAIAPVGAEIPYDPQQHQLMEGTAAPGDLVRVRYTGYRQGERLLYRAKVSPLVT